MKPEIYIVTGPVHTGKSTTVWQWCQQQQSEGKTVRGLMNPTINKEKYFVDVSSGEQFAMEEKDPDAADVVRVGKYTFSVSAFQRARDIIQRDAALPADAFVIDEIGKLELQGEGLEPSIRNALVGRDLSHHGHIYLLVRDYLVEEVVTAYGLEEATVITKTDLES